MKQIMIALAILGITFSGAEAQTKTQVVKEIQTCPAKKKVKKVAHKKRTTTTTYAKRYQICTDEGGYNNCCVYTKRVASVTKTR